MLKKIQIIINESRASKLGLTKNAILKILLVLFLIIIFIVSLMPIIAWLAGLVGLAYLILAIYLKIRPEKITLKNIGPTLTYIWSFKTGRLSYYAILFGLLIHGACRIHSELLIRELHHEALQEKNIIIKTENK